MALITIDKNAYEHNLGLIANKAGGVEKVICVLKDNAYGHGVELIAPLAKQMGVNFAALKNENQAIFLQGFFKNILILSHHPHGKESDEFIYALNSKDDLARLKNGSRIHLKIDTGMHRNGVFVEDLEEIFDKAKRHNLYIEGLFTHFAAADESEDSYLRQKEVFELAKKRALKLSSQRLIFHSHNSAALFRCENFPQDELCRVGLAQFGYNEFCANLKPILKLYAHKLSSRTLRAGQSVGYGGIFTTQNDLNIATYDLGYADGLFRYDGKGILPLATPSKLENIGEIQANLAEIQANSSENSAKNACAAGLVGEPNSHKAHACLLGRMSMDSFSCEDLGDCVCVFEDARAWAKFFHTIEYEILVKLSPFIPRVLV